MSYTNLAYVTLTLRGPHKTLVVLDSSMRILASCVVAVSKNDG